MLRAGCRPDNWRDAGATTTKLRRDADGRGRPSLHWSARLHYFLMVSLVVRG
jgi:hypothetical protein